ncbi:SGNH/GDSL hydrolase family protein [Methylocella sp.]|uniref:SGNH/GDSL hydrolase family protein n=1 Tax=Methylocella sp. TaxID=1978226 RepID=UPI003784DE17
MSIKPAFADDKPAAPSRTFHARAAVSLMAIAALAGLAVFVETRHRPEHFRLVSVICVFLALGVGASLLRGRWRDGMLVLASIALGLSVLEGVAAWMEPAQKIVATEGFNVRRAVLGWGPGTPGVFHEERTDPQTGAVIYSAVYGVDAGLVRRTRSLASGPTIAFFGDSVTFGVGLNDEDALPQQFADLLDPPRRVLNLAFPGYGPQHFLRALETGLFDSVIGADPRLFIFVTSPWHIERSACKASWVIDAPRYELERGRPVFKGACYEGVALKARQFFGNSALYRMFVDPYRRRATRAEVETYIAILTAATRLAQEKYGVPTLIPYLEVSQDFLRGTGMTNEAIMEALRRGGARVLDISTIEKTQADPALLAIPGDGHPTALANKIRARALVAYVKAQAPEVETAAGR